MNRNEEKRTSGRCAGRTGDLRTALVCRLAAPPPRVPQQHHVVATEIRVWAAAHAVGRVRRQGQVFSTVVRAVSQPQVLAVHAVLDRTTARRRRGFGARHIVR